jgi:hypothetical protein
MRNLANVLIFKILVTAVFWFAPLLFLPGSLITRLGFPACPSVIFLRLLGMAYGSLLVGYVFGLVATRQGRYPGSMVWIGIVSNGGAFALLVIGAIQGVWVAWGALAGLYMWTSLAATGLITAGLIAFGPGGRHSHSERRG